MTTLPKDILSCLLNTALSYAKCAGDDSRRSCIIYSSKRKTIVSMGHQVDMLPPEYMAQQKLRWLDKGGLYAVCNHPPTSDGADYLIKMGVKEVYYMEKGNTEGILKLKSHGILSTRLLYG